MGLMLEQNLCLKSAEDCEQREWSPCSHNSKEISIQQIVVATNLEQLVMSDYATKLMGSAHASRYYTQLS